MNINPNKALKDTFDGIDKLTESGEERQATLTERQKLDTTSPFMLPQLIRPIIPLCTMAMQIAIFVAMFLEIEVPTDIVWEVGALNAATIGFYFNSRRNEKINSKKVQAAIKIEKIKARSSKRMSRRERRQEKTNSNR